MYRSNSGMVARSRAAAEEFERVRRFALNRE
jgi:hypothetical protein